MPRFDFWRRDSRNNSNYLSQAYSPEADGGSEASRRLMHFMDWLEGVHPQRHEHITHLGDPVILNNGVEFAATYFVMLLVLFCFGGGKYVSLDYWIRRRYTWRT